MSSDGSYSAVGVLDPDSVANPTRAAWCNSQITTCLTLCGGSLESNTCSIELTCKCVCQDNTIPDLSRYQGTLPSFVNAEVLKECTEGHSSSLEGQKSCQDIPKPGTQKPSRVAGSISSTSSATSTPTRLPSQTSTPNNVPNHTNSGISTVAKAEIGAGAGLAVFIFAIIAILLYRRRKSVSKNISGNELYTEKAELSAESTGAAYHRHVGYGMVNELEDEKIGRKELCAGDKEFAAGTQYEDDDYEGKHKAEGW